MRMKMNTSLSGPTVNVAPGGVHTCSSAEAIRHYRAGHGTPTDDCAEEFHAGLAELEAIEAADLAAEKGEGGITDPAPAPELTPATEPAPVVEPTPATAPAPAVEPKPATEQKPAKAAKVSASAKAKA